MLGVSQPASRHAWLPALPLPRLAICDSETDGASHHFQSERVLITANSRHNENKDFSLKSHYKQVIERC